MWFKNKQTGLMWEIVNKEVIERLQKDKNYILINEKPKTENIEVEEIETAEMENEEIKEPEDEKIVDIVDYETISWQDLKKLAVKHDINTYKMSKYDIINSLKDMGV